MTLIGTYTSTQDSGSGALIWEAPGNIRFNRSDQPGKPLIYSPDVGLIGAVRSGGADANILESLLDDSSEAFLYGFQGGNPHRFIGGGYKEPGGSIYTIYETSGPVRADLNHTTRIKHYYIEQTKNLLVKTQYILPDSQVSTEFSNWSTIEGQAVPGRIVRKENGGAVLSITFTNATFGPAVSDGTFTGN